MYKLRNKAEELFLRKLLASSVRLRCPPIAQVALLTESHRSLRDYRLQINLVGPERDDHINKASHALDGLKGKRILRATLQSSQTRIREIEEGATKLRKENDNRTS